MQVTKIIMFPKIQPDTTIALFLLKTFGEELFLGIRGVEVDFWTKVPEGKDPKQFEQEGVLLLDMGGGRFDHHNKRDAGSKMALSKIVAQELGVVDDPAIEKLLAYAHRDDVEGKGTISKDPLDRAFGLSGLIMSMNRDYPDNPKKVLQAVWPLIESHYHEEKRRNHELPIEYKKLGDDKKTKEMSVRQGSKKLKVVLLESDNVAMPGFLRANKEVQADVVVQKMSSGHVNVVTKQWKKVDLKNLVIVLRVDEMRRKGVDLKKINWDMIGRPGFLDEAPQWYYDTAATTIQNGGVCPQNIEPTSIPWEEFPNLMEIGLDPEKFEQTISKSS